MQLQLIGIPEMQLQLILKRQQLIAMILLASLSVISAKNNMEHKVMYHLDTFSVMIAEIPVNLENKSFGLSIIYFPLLI